MSSPITPESVHVLENEGMPIFQESSGARKVLPKGNLYIKFDIQFPKMNIDQKQKIVQILKKNEQETDAEENS